MTKTNRTVWIRVGVPLAFIASGLAWWAIIDLARALLTAS
jgi:hypothetical protein